jgi:hypothetical protein
MKKVHPLNLWEHPKGSKFMQIAHKISCIKLFEQEVAMF